jgi:glyoxylase-like metal-dependent hydrolase (beta-lactamase superfamily II)
MTEGVMIIKGFEVGAIAGCCYIVVDERAKDAMVIDPGGDGDFLVEEIKALHARPLYLVNTHGHADHMAANGDIKAAFPEIQILIHADDAELLTNPQKNLSFFIGEEISSPPADRLLKDGDKIALGGNAFKVIHIPGHTRGGICLYCEKPDGKTPGVVFTGDTLFQMGIGRTDFPDPDFSEAQKFKMLTGGIREKILTLPEETVVYPGHGPATTVGNEKRRNPFLSGSGTLWLP